MNPDVTATADPAWRRYVPAVPAALAVLAAGAAFQRVFTFADAAGPVIVASLFGAGAGVAARRALTAPHDGMEPAPPPSVGACLIAAAAVIAGGLVSAVVAAAAFATPTSGPGSALTTGVGALVRGWSRILTTSVPVPATPDRLPLAAGLVGLAAGWAVVAASRRRPGVDALLPAGLVLLIALLLGVGGPGSVAEVAGPPLALAAIYLLVVSRPAGQGVRWVPPGRARAAVTTGAVVLAVAIGIGTHLPLAGLRHPVDLRSAVAPRLVLSTTPNPLDQLPAWQKEPATVMFTASVDGAWRSAPTNWRLVSLDVYDGTGWSTDADASTAGNVLRLPPGVSSGLLGPEVHVTVHIAALGGPWVPTVGVPTSVSPAGLDFNPESSVVLSPGARTSYALGGRLAEPSRAALDAAGIGSGASVAALTAVPACLPASLRTLAATAAAGLQRPDQQAVAVQQELAAKGGFHLDQTATAGSSCARLTEFSTARSGTEEQFATAFALMARSIGLPSRLAVGFTAGAIDPARATTVVTGADATVWPEVDLGRLGWVAFNPVPTSHGSGQAGRRGGGPSTTVPVAQRGLNQVQQSVAAAQSHPSAPTPRSGSSTVTGRLRAAGGLPWPVIAVVSLAAVVAALIGIRAVARRRRRARRRSASDPVKRVLGAWSELLDALAPFRLPVRSLTPSEVARRAAEVAPPAAEATEQLAQLVDRAVYAGDADEAVAARAWASSDIAVSAVGHSVPTGRRVRGLFAGPR